MIVTRRLKTLLNESQRRGFKMAIDNVKNILLVSSAKGGVGKSTVTANIASALHLQGKKIGVVDCDIYGPSQNKMFGITESPENPHDPVESHGILVNSIANRIDEGQTIAWRGPMLKIAVMDLILDTSWGDLDYLVVDMPPGTGDIQLSICEKLTESQAVIVTTPQDVATIDTERGIDLFQKSGISLVGVVENMSGFVCRHCGEVEYIFGSGGGQKIADKYNMKFLGEIPIETNIRKKGDSGKPIAFETDSAIGSIYMKIVKQILDESDT